MTIKDFFDRENCTIEEFSAESGIPESTLGDILNGVSDLRFCQARTINKLSKALCMSVDDILRLEPAIQSGSWIPDPTINPVHAFENPAYFAAFRRQMIEEIRHRGEEAFVLGVLRSSRVEGIYLDSDYPEALYLIGLLDYLAAKNGILRITRFDRYRAEMMESPIYAPLAEKMTDYTPILIVPAIPQLLKFNFIETPETLGDLGED